MTKEKRKRKSFGIYIYNFVMSKLVQELKGGESAKINGEIFTNFI